MPEEAKTLAAALNDVTEEDLASATAADESASDDDAGGDGGGDGEEDAGKGDEGEGAEEEDDDAAADDGEGADDAEDGDEDEDGDEEGDEEAGAADDDDEPNALALTPEDLAAIRADPKLSKLYKNMVRGVTKKGQANSEAIKLATAFQKNPDFFLETVAKARGYNLEKPAAAGETKAPAEKPRAVAAKKLEALFNKPGTNDGVGAKVRQILDEYFETLVAEKIAPLGSTLESVVKKGETARMMSEEVSWKARHKDVMTPEVEAAVAELGNSGRYLPGDDVTPAQYLDDLLEMVLSKQARRTAVTSLKKRIKRNKDDEEPVRGVSAKGGVKPTTRIRPDMKIGDAFDQAARELDAE